MKSSKLNSSKKSIKLKLRYTADHVKNKQSNIPFSNGSKFKQPINNEYNRYGTISNMQSEQTSKQTGDKLKKIVQDRNE